MIIQYPLQISNQESTHSGQSPLSHNKLRPVSPQYDVDIKEGDGFETYGLKQEQNQKMMESLKLKIEERFKPKRIKSTVMTKLSMSLRHEVSQMDYRSEDKRFKGNYKPEKFNYLFDWSIRG